MKGSLLISASLFATATAGCDSNKDCASCLSVGHFLNSENPNDEKKVGTNLLACRWCPKDNECHTQGSLFNPCSSSEQTEYVDQCSLSPALPTPESDFLANWQTELNPLIGNLTLLDLSLPGTHDTLTYDLSTTVSAGGIDDYPELSDILHFFSNSVDLIPGQIEDFIRQQATTQKLSVTEQLDAGIRFLDFRYMMEANKKWYSLHMLQSNNQVNHYLSEIKNWMDKHPKEIVVLWGSKHGSGCATGEDQFPGVNADQKQAMFKEMMGIFDGLVIDTRINKLGEATINELLESNHRLIPYLADYEEFTGSSPFALDGCKVDNRLGSSVDNEINARSSEQNAFLNAADVKAEDKLSDKLYLRSMATSSPSAQVEAAANLFLNPFVDNDKVTQECADSFNIPGMSFCPETLMDIAQLGTYYKQISLEEAYVNFDKDGSAEFPNAIYLDAVDVDGTIRVGTTLLWGETRSDAADEGHARYPYADTLIGFNAKKACSLESHNDCDRLIEMIEGRRSRYPYTRWSDDKYGRQIIWPDSA